MSSINFEFFKKINIQTKYAVYGYIRNAETLLIDNTSHIIPLSVYHICTLFYYIVNEISTGQSSIEGKYHRYDNNSFKGTDIRSIKQTYKAWDTIQCVQVLWHSIPMDYISPNQIIHLETSFEQLKKLNHPNITIIKDYWSNYKTKKFCYITNVLNHGIYYNLSEYLQNNINKIDLKFVKSICKQILNGLNYLHKMNVIHKSLRLKNIFIHSTNKTIILRESRPIEYLDDIDVGPSHSLMPELCDAAYIMAPEAYRETYDKMIDIWSFGLCVLHLITSKTPYLECKNMMILFKKISGGLKPDSLKTINDPYIRLFIDICLNIDPNKRASAMELLQHPFLFNKRSDNILCQQLIKSNKPSKPQNEQEYKDVINGYIKNAQNILPNYSSYFNIAPLVNKLCLMYYVILKRVLVLNAVKKENITHVKLEIIHINIKNKIIVEFDFDHKCDTASSVTDEMVNVLELRKDLTLHILRGIELAISD